MSYNNEIVLQGKRPFCSIAGCVRFLSFSVLIFGAFYKPVRSITGYSFIRDLNYYGMIFIFVLITMFLTKRKLVKLDGLILLSLSVLITSYVIDSFLFGPLYARAFVAIYILPLSIYFAFRFVPIKEEGMVKAIYLFTIISSCMLYLEFITVNFTGYTIFNFVDYWNTIMGGSVEKIDTRDYPFLGKLIRPWGISGRSQATGPLFGGLFLFAFTQYRFRGRHRSYSRFIMIISIISIYVAGSWTAFASVIIVLILIYVGVNILSLSIAVFFGFFIPLVVLQEFKYMNYLRAFWEAIHDLFRVYFVEMNYSSFRIIFFGQGLSHQSHSLISSQVGWITTLFNVGILNFAILILILIKYTNYLKRLRRSEDWPIHLSGFCLFAALLLASVHYEALFIYPSNVIVLALMGYTANCHHIQIIKNKRKTGS